MKYKSLTTIFVIAILLMLSASTFANKPASILGPHFIAESATSDMLKGKLNKAVSLIETEGNKTFEKIAQMNVDLKGNFGIFVIEPETGKLLVSPPKKTLGKYPLISKELNGKSLARMIIKNELLRRNESFVKTLEYAYGLVYKNYFATLAITPEGNLFVVAIGKNSAEMQKLFIEKGIMEACLVMKKMGVDKAIKIFNKQDSLFRFGNTYIFVYGDDKENKGTLLCNPNYPQYVGQNSLKVKTEFTPVLKSIFKLTDEEGYGWLTDTTKNPVTGKDQLKRVYVRKVKVKGKSYIVGSGVYVEPED